MARFYYSRTNKIVDIPDDRAHLYDNRRWYFRMDDPLEVPDGPVAEILAWVGDNPKRRAAALKAEREGKRRKTLLAALT